MRLIRHLVLITASLPVLAVSALAQQRPDSVSLRFNWAPGTTARVEQEWMRVQASPAKRDSFEVRSSYRMRVEHHAEGRLIHADSFALARIGGGPQLEANSAQNQRLALQLATLYPSYVVSTDGEFRRLANAEVIRKFVDSLIAPILTGMKDAPPQARAMLQNLSSEEALSASAIQEWNAVAGTWAGADWVVGEAYENDVEEPIAVFPGMKIPMHYEFSAVERVRCEPAQSRKACVRLVMYSAPDTAGLRRMTTELLQQIGADQKEVVDALRNMRSENELEVIAEPATLRPYSVIRTQRITVKAAATAGEPGGTTTRLDVRKATYRYR